MSRSSRYPKIVPQLPAGDELYDLLVVDRHLAVAAEKLRILRFITPVNSREVREAYLAESANGGPRTAPDFLYRDEDDDLDTARRELFAVPIKSDSEVGQLYRRKRDELNDILTMLQARGTTEFRERSRLLYGTTTREELDALSGWLSLPPDPPAESKLSAREAAHFLRSRLSQARLWADVRIRHSLSSAAAAGESSVGVRSDATFSTAELHRIFVHEAETHILRYRNGERQPFRALFYHGFPRHADEAGNYMNTEEGLATFQEEMTGNLTNDRRRMLAGRALAIYLMDSEGLAFHDVFDTLREQHSFGPEDAYSITERAFRGGGYTKDHIYHTGYMKVREAILSGRLDLRLLFAGKTSLGWMDLVGRLFSAGSGCLHVPRFLPMWLRTLLTARMAGGDDASDDAVSITDAMLTEKPIYLTEQDLSLIGIGDDGDRDAGTAAGATTAAGTAEDRSPEVPDYPTS